MKITIICVGKLKESYLKDAVNEYSKRIGRYAKLEIVEVGDEKAPEELSPAQEKLVLEKEGERILKKIDPGSFVFSLAIQGTQQTSEAFAKTLAGKMSAGISSITFVIGGSLGLSEAVLAGSDALLSFSKMTFPHQLMRVILLEQVYRAYKIMKNEPYHK